MGKTIGYIHTLNGQPARYNGAQTYYCGRYNPTIIVDSLKQIRKEQRLSHNWRMSKGYEDDWTEYGYMRIVTTPTTEKE